MSTKSQSELVREFTSGASVTPLPITPRLMTRDRVSFITKMILSELVELNQTVFDTAEDAMKNVRECMGVDIKPDYKPPADDIERCAHQYDALVDIMYYAEDTAIRHGVNLSKLFTVVHQSNMDKRGPDGKFHRRDDGKIIKPEGWKEPNVTNVIKHQLEHGAW